jgi:hypothetical protein
MLLAVLGPALLKVTVPDTVDPALTLAGKLSVVERSASAVPPIVVVAELLAVFGSAGVAVTLAVTVDVAAPGCV